MIRIWLIKFFMFANIWTNIKIEIWKFENHSKVNVFRLNSNKKLCPLAASWKKLPNFLMFLYWNSRFNSISHSCFLLSTKMHRAALTSRIALQSWTSRHCAIVNCLSGIPSTWHTVFKLITGIYYAFRQSVHLSSLLCFHFWYSSSCFQVICDTFSNHLYVLLAKKSLIFSSIIF